MGYGTFKFFIEMATGVKLINALDGAQLHWECHDIVYKENLRHLNMRILTPAMYGASEYGITYNVSFPNN